MDLEPPLTGVGHLVSSMETLREAHPEEFSSTHTGEGRKALTHLLGTLKGYVARLERLT
jgi:hypothetical protein